jgi:uncharacterized protein (DUF488 family)
MDNGYEKSPPVFTIGHSTRTLNDFISMLKAHSVAMVVDIRTVPRSRHNPRFNIETMPENLSASGIGNYTCQDWEGFAAHEKITEPGLAQPVFQRFCRLHADTGI